MAPDVTKGVIEGAERLSHDLTLALSQAQRWRLTLPENYQGPSAPIEQAIHAATKAVQDFTALAVDDLSHPRDVATYSPDPAPRSPLPEQTGRK